MNQTYPLTEFVLNAFQITFKAQFKFLNRLL